MKIRSYSPEFPFPVREGGHQLIFDQARGLAQMGHQVEMITWKDTLDSIARKITEAEEDFPPHIKVRLLSESSPPRTLKEWLKDSPKNPSLISTGGQRSNQESKTQRMLRLSLSLLSSHASPETFYYPLSYADQKFNERNETCDLAIYNYSFSHAWLAKRGPLASERRSVVFFQNLESDLFQFRASTSSHPLAKAIHHLNAKKLYRHELELSQWADELWFVSPPDLENFQRRLKKSRITPKSDLRLITPTYDPEVFEKRKKRFESFLAASTTEPAGPVLGFIGGLGYGPNVASATWILRELAPRLEERDFRGTLIIAGGGASEELKREALKYPFISMPGFVKDLESFLDRLSYMLVPHIEGSGVRIKLLDALAGGIPVLATKTAVERLHPALQTHSLIFASDDPQAWAEKILHSPTPFGERLKNNEKSLPEFLRAEKIYDFLSHD